MAAPTPKSDQLRQLREPSIFLYEEGTQSIEDPYVEPSVLSIPELIDALQRHLASLSEEDQAYAGVAAWSSSSAGVLGAVDLRENDWNGRPKYQATLDRLREKANG